MVKSSFLNCQTPDFSEIGRVFYDLFYGRVMIYLFLTLTPPF